MFGLDFKSLVIVSLREAFSPVSLIWDASIGDSILLWVCCTSCWWQVFSGLICLEKPSFCSWLYFCVAYSAFSQCWFHSPVVLLRYECPRNHGFPLLFLLPVIDQGPENTDWKMHPPARWNTLPCVWTRTHTHPRDAEATTSHHPSSLLVQYAFFPYYATWHLLGFLILGAGVFYHFRKILFKYCLCLILWYSFCI